MPTGAAGRERYKSRKAIVAGPVKVKCSQCKVRFANDKDGLCENCRKFQPPAEGKK